MADATLVERWEAAGRPGICTVEELVEVLADGFRAYPLPIDAFGRPLYDDDEQLGRGEVVALMTITHPDVLDRIYGEQERRMQDIGPDGVEEYARSLFLFWPRGEDEPVVGDVLTMEHALGRRSSVAIAAQDGIVSGYRLFGHSHLLAQALRAYAPVFADEAVREGRTDDPAFDAWLEDLAAAGRI